MDGRGPFEGGEGNADLSQARRNGLPHRKRASRLHDNHVASGLRIRNSGEP